MQSLVKGNALQLFNKKVKELENQINAHHAECISAVSGYIFSKECSADAEVLLAKGPSTQSDDHLQVHHMLSSEKWLFCPISPCMAERHKTSN